MRNFLTSSEVLRKYMRTATNREVKSKHEDRTKKIIARLEREGWTNVGGANHDKFTKAGNKPIIVPRHISVSPGVARSIATAAGW